MSHCSTLVVVYDGGFPQRKPNRAQCEDHESAFDVWSVWMNQRDECDPRTRNDPGGGKHSQRDAPTSKGKPTLSIYHSRFARTLRRSQPDR